MVHLIMSCGNASTYITWESYGQGSQKLYNWQNIVSPPHYRNDVHHPHDIICLYCRGHQDESEYIYFYIVYVSHLSSIDEYCRTFGSNTVILACLQTHIAHSILLHKKVLIVIKPFMILSVSYHIAIVF